MTEADDADLRTCVDDVHKALCGVLEQGATPDRSLLIWAIAVLAVVSAHLTIASKDGTEPPVKPPVA